MLCVRYVELAEAREVLDALKTMCPPPAGCMSLEYLREAMSKANIVEGAFVRELRWNECFEEKCSPLNITEGDSILFFYGSSHDVVKVATADEYETCSLLTADVVGSTSAGTAGYKHTFDKVGTHYFACGRSTHCVGGQKAVVQVHAARKAPSTGGAAPSYSNAPLSTMPATSVTSPAATFYSFAAILASVLAAAAVLVV